MMDPILLCNVASGWVSRVGGTAMELISNIGGGIGLETRLSRAITVGTKEDIHVPDMVGS